MSKLAKIVTLNMKFEDMDYFESHFRLELANIVTLNGKSLLEIHLKAQISQKSLL